MSDSTVSDERSEFIAGLRALADLLEQTPDLPLPKLGGVSNAVGWNVWGTYGEDVPTEVARIARLLPGKLDKNDPSVGGYAEGYFNLSGPLRGLVLQITAHRADVCERVVIDVRPVTRLVPAPDAPMVEVVDEVETVEWVCRPILAAAVSS